MKKITKSLTTIGLASAVLFTSLAETASAAQVHYEDVNKADNFYSSVEYLLEKEAISKTLPHFRPYENITRGQFASIYAKANDYSFLFSFLQLNTVHLHHSIQYPNLRPFHMILRKNLILTIGSSRFLKGIFNNLTLK